MGNSQGRQSLARARWPVIQRLNIHVSRGAAVIPPLSKDDSRGFEGSFYRGKLGPAAAVFLKAKHFAELNNQMIGGGNLGEKRVSCMTWQLDLHVSQANQRENPMQLLVPADPAWIPLQG